MPWSVTESARGSWRGLFINHLKLVEKNIAIKMPKKIGTGG